MEARFALYHHTELTGQIIAAAIKVHSKLGPGLLESVYRTCLQHELRSRQLETCCEVEIPVVYEGVRLDCGFRADLIVAKSVIVELKCVERLLPIHEAQLLTYLKLASIRVGLLLNFNTSSLRNGIRRLAR